MTALDHVFYRVPVAASLRITFSIVTYSGPGHGIRHFRGGRRDHTAMIPAVFLREATVSDTVAVPCIQAAEAAAVTRFAQ